MKSRTDDLVAKVRKSIEGDFDALDPLPQGSARGDLMRNALREMRVNMGLADEDWLDREEQISDLRTRIKLKAAEAEIEPDGLGGSLLRPSLLDDEEGDLHVKTPQRPSQNQPVTIDYQAGQPAAPARHYDENSWMNEVVRPPVRQPAFQPPASEPAFNPAPAFPQQPGYGAGQGFAPQQQAYAQPPAFEPAPVYGQGQQAYLPAPEVYEDQAYEEQAYEEPLMSAHAAGAAENAFQQLSDAMLQRATGGQSLEDLTRELLRGMLQQWLDDNLPPLVEQLVREEIQRVSRRGR